MTDRYAVIGNPIAQSKSPIIHGLFAQETRENISYERVEAPLGGFAATVDRLRAEGYRGVNITAPFKVEAFSYASERSSTANQAGAANALKFDGASVIAENFDGIGLIRDIELNLATPLKAKRVLILGAGGATRGALVPILKAAPAALFIVNRDLAKARAVADEVVPNRGVGIVTYETISRNAAAFGAFDVVLNSTSSSLTAACPPIAQTVFRDASLAYDLTYGKGLTPFLKLAQASGASRVADGVGMLVEQAAEAFAWWRGVRPNTAGAIAAITVPLA